MTAQTIADCEKRMLFVCLYIFDVQQNKVVEIKFFYVFNALDDSSKWKILFHAINNALKNDGLDLENVVSVSLDNSHTSLTKENSVTLRMQHLAHIVVCKGGQGYCSATGFNWIKSTCFTFLTIA